MTVTSTNRSVTYTGNGSTTVFSVGFYFEAAWIVATLSTVNAAGEVLSEEVLDDEDYTLAGAGETSGGTLTYPLAGDPIGALQRLTIERVVPVTQERAFSNLKPYDATQHGAAFDKLTMIAQAHDDDLERCVKVPLGEDTDPDSFYAALRQDAADAETAKTAAQAAQAAAEDAQEGAEEAAAKVPAIVAGDADKFLTVKGDESGNEYVGGADAREKLGLGNSALLGALTANTVVNFTSSMTVAEIQALIDAQPKNLDGYTLTFQFADGTYSTGMTSPLGFGRFYNGNVFILGNTSETDATVLHTTQSVVLDFSAGTSNGLYIHDCSAFVTVKNLGIKVSNTSGRACIYCERCRYVAMLYSYLYGAGTTYPLGVALRYGANGRVDASYVSNLYGGIQVRDASNLVSFGNDSSAAGGAIPIYGLQAFAALTFKGGAQPTGSTANEQTNYGGLIS